MLRSEASSLTSKPAPRLYYRLDEQSLTEPSDRQAIQELNNTQNANRASAGH